MAPSRAGNPTAMLVSRAHDNEYSTLRTVKKGLLRKQFGLGYLALGTWGCIMGMIRKPRHLTHRRMITNNGKQY